MDESCKFSLKLRFQNQMYKRWSHQLHLNDKQSIPTRHPNRYQIDTELDTELDNKYQRLS